MNIEKKINEFKPQNVKIWIFAMHLVLKYLNVSR